MRTDLKMRRKLYLDSNRKPVKKNEKARNRFDSNSVLTNTYFFFYFCLMRSLRTRVLMEIQFKQVLKENKLLLLIGKLEERSVSDTHLCTFNRKTRERKRRTVVEGLTTASLNRG